jgi:cyclic pyranopterin phosphate synthase
VDFDVRQDGIEVQCYVSARARTGVEMEALVGVSMALNTLWDMVKYLEKDDRGQYPFTRITDIRVLKKEKLAKGD